MGISYGVLNLEDFGEYMYWLCYDMIKKIIDDYRLHFMCTHITDCGD